MYIHFEGAQTEQLHERVENSGGWLWGDANLELHVRLVTKA